MRRVVVRFTLFFVFRSASFISRFVRSARLCIILGLSGISVLLHGCCKSEVKKELMKRGLSFSFDELSSSRRPFSTQPPPRQTVQDQDVSYGFSFLSQGEGTSNLRRREFSKARKKRRRRKKSSAKLTLLPSLPSFCVQIPDEILLEILDWLPRGSAYVSFALVCSRMHRVRRRSSFGSKLPLFREIVELELTPFFLFRSPSRSLGLQQSESFEWDLETWRSLSWSLKDAFRSSPFLRWPASAGELSTDSPPFFHHRYSPLPHLHGSSESSSFTPPPATY